MLSLQQIMNYYPNMSESRRENCLREYLQYKILKIVFNSKWWNKLRFIWWTALRIIYGNARFSEDIDFDNDGTMTFEEFSEMWLFIQKSLEAEWLVVRTRSIQKWAFHCNISIPEILYNNNLAPMKTQTILIQIDTHCQWYDYQSVNHFLSKFDVQSDILTVSPQLLLAQKLYTVFERKRLKWRDFFDIAFLLWITKKPDYWFLNQKLWINNPSDLKKYMQNKIIWLDLIVLQKDVQPFLFDSNDKSVELFDKIIEQTNFE